VVNYNTTDIIVAGADVVTYKYKLDTGVWNAETSPLHFLFVYGWLRGKEAPLKTVVYGGHKIEIPEASLTGKEEVRYDGKVVSHKHSVFGATHMFRVQEDGEDVQYEVELGARWHHLSNWTVVRRNGNIIYTDR
jgi:hypothetical protein